jgi:hypothetical protein
MMNGTRGEHMMGAGPVLRHYRLPRRVMLSMGPDLALGRRRSFADDCAAMVGQMRPAPVVDGLEHIPSAGPFMLLANHYEGPGLWIGWSAALLTDAVARVRPAPVPVHWLVIGAMDRGRVRGVKRWAPSTDWVFGRVAHAWSMVALPRPDAPPAARATALRRLVHLVAPPPDGRGEPAGLFPEGEGDGFAGLRPAAPGSGRLLALLARRGVPALPAAVWAEEGRLHARFGPAWRADDGDDAALRAEAMHRIAALLPASMRGCYASDHAVSGGGG